MGTVNASQRAHVIDRQSLEMDAPRVPVQGPNTTARSRLRPTN
jgi:hypothetical protein